MKDDAEKVKCRQNVWRTVVRTMKDKEEQEEGEKDEGVRAAPNMGGPVAHTPRPHQTREQKRQQRKGGTSRKKNNSARKECTVRIRKKS